MSVTAADIQALSSSFADVDDEIIENLIEFAEEIVSANIWGKKLDLGIKYYTAHLLSGVLDEDSDYSGSIVKEKVGDLETQYGTSTGAASDDSDLKSTSWGKMYLTLLRSLVPTPLVAC